jgi:23S rRNA C2498 (ribose-2'-O)-methylase RlmM
MQFPTETDRLLGSGKYAAGPTGVALWQANGWTYGMLANHLWSYAGDSNRNNVSSTFLQPFVSYTTKDAWTFTLNTESTYNWITDKWSVPVNATIAKLIKFGDQPVQIGGGPRYWLAMTCH